MLLNLIVAVKIKLLCLTVVPKWLIVMEQILAVTMQAQKEAPPDLQCKDKFLLQSVAAPDGATTKDIVPELVGWFCFCSSFIVEIMNFSCY